MAPSSPLEATITELEDSTWKALQKDGASLIPFLSKDCIMLFPMGMKVSATTDPNLKEVMTSEAFVPWKSYEMSDVEVTSLGENAAVICYRVEALRQEINAPDDGVGSVQSLDIQRVEKGSRSWLMANGVASANTVHYCWTLIRN